MTGNPKTAAGGYKTFDARRRSAQIEVETRLRLKEPEVGYRACSAPLPEVDWFGEPVSRWRGQSPVLGLPFERLEFKQPGTLRPVIVRRFLRRIVGYDDN